MNLKSVFLALGMASALSAGAFTITPGSAITQVGNQNNLLDANYFSGVLGTAMTDLYAQSTDGSPDSGPYAGSYSTTFIPSVNPTGAMVEYGNGQPVIGGFGAVYLYVKDGQATPAWYLFDISAWNGTDTLALESFWGPQTGGSITYLGLFGARTAGAAGVPDGGTTVLLLGSALAGLGTVRRLIKRW